uniref:FAD synthase n=1 Tax=Aceria tosichella TaxID=561515 RepID=A0A6G1SHP0_9ACAR
MDPMSKIIKYAQVHKHVQESIEIIERAFSKYKIENTCLSFNGGKDCTAVLHLVHSVSRKFSVNNNDEPKLAVFYAQLPNHFQEESDFVSEIVKRYNLKLLQYSTSSLKESLRRLKQDVPEIEAIFIGTRRDDFKGAIDMPPEAPTDNDWPQYMRINPIVKWSYSQVWDFIRELQVPYCDLYNQGYSSLGTSDNTIKNSSLLRYKDGQPYYLPAWHLASSKEERRSRSEEEC